MKLKKALWNIKELKMHWKNWGGIYCIKYLKGRLFKNRNYKTRLYAIELLNKKYGYIFNNWSKVKYSINKDSNYKMFVYWAQGVDNAPYLIKKVIDNLKKYYPNKDIVVLTNDNFSEYVTLNQKILDYYQSGKITVQTFSDILRFNLLYKYGGFWIDATLLFLNQIPIFDYLDAFGFYSLNMEDPIKEKLWGKVFPVTYTTFFLGCDKNNPNMGACVEFYNKYYEEHDYAIDYLMNDYMLILCMKYSIANDQLKKIPKCNSSPFNLINYLNSNETMYLDVYTCPQKMNWRLGKYNVDQFIKTVSKLEK